MARASSPRLLQLELEVIEDDGRSTAKKLDVVLVPLQAERLAYKLLMGLARVGWKFCREYVQDDDAAAA